MQIVEPAGLTCGLAADKVAGEVEDFYLVQRLRIARQLATRDPIDANRVDPDNLNELHRLMSKEAFHQAKNLQLRLRQEYDL